MKTLRHSLALVVLLIALAPVNLRAQASAEWRDDLVDHMIGSWKLQGQAMGRDAHHDVDAEWVLNQFVARHTKK
jgi:hypothetical protein